MAAPGEGDSTVSTIAFIGLGIMGSPVLILWLPVKVRWMINPWQARRRLGCPRAAARSGVPVVAIAGRLQLSPQQLSKAGISAAR